jgi:hypothetical protein
MGVLTSNLFTNADPETVDRLENCATGRPNEVQSHFTLNQSGEHIRRVQEALKSVQESNPGLGIPGFSVNGVYDLSFANAIRVYKTKRNIKNFADKIDDIVGVKTLRSLDQENKSGPPKVNPGTTPQPKKPGEFPRPSRPNPSTCVTDLEAPLTRDFSNMLIGGATGGEILEAGFFVFMIQDQRNRLACLYSLSAGGIATPGLPVSPSGAGKPSPFQTSKETRVTRFGPIGGITSLTIGPPGAPPIGPQNKTLLSALSFSFKLPDSSVPAGTVFIKDFDTGPVSIAGGGIHGGRFQLHSVCRGGPGADRTS